MVDKKVLRQVYLEKRLTLTQAEYQQRNQLLQKKILEEVDLSNARIAHIFLSIIKQKEIDTQPIMTLLKNRYPDLHFAVSKTLPDRQLKHYILNEETQLKTSSWGIPEPVSGNNIDEEQTDVVFVPLIICDKKGYRIGYGGGYYDIFLSKIPKAVKIGLSLAPLLDKIPFVEDFDVKLDMCVTPYGIYYFR